jgi:hypothetical protein
MPMSIEDRINAIATTLKAMVIKHLENNPTASCHYLLFVNADDLELTTIAAKRINKSEKVKIKVRAF